MKRNFTALLLMCFVTTFSFSVETPVILWTIDLLDSSFGVTAAGDIDGDGKLELVFGCYRNDDHIYAVNAEDGSILWKYNASFNGYDGCNDVAPILYDIDGDNIPEVFVPSSCNHIVTCFRGLDGSIIWQKPTRGSDSPPTIADLDNDGKMEIIFGEFGGYVLCLDIETGEKKWEILVDVNSWIQTAPTIVDLDLDGNLDFVVATWNAVEGDTNRVYAYRGYDQKLLWSYDINDVVYHGTAIANLDDDPYPELILGDYSGTLYAINGEDGSEFWTKSHYPDFYIPSPVIVGDIDGDGECELIYSSYLYVVCLNKQGEVKWSYPVPDYPSIFRGVILADVDNDYLLDVIFGTNDGKIIALKGTYASLLWKIDFPKEYGIELNIDHAPIFADFDGDGLPEIFFIGGKTSYPDVSENYGKGYCLSLKSGTGPDWLMFQNNIHRTGSVCDNFTSVRNFFEKPEIKFYPNPAEDFLNIEIEKEAVLLSREVQILDILGLVVSVSELKDGNNKIDISNFSRGTYFIKVGDRVEKFIKM